MKEKRPQKFHTGNHPATPSAPPLRTPLVPDLEDESETDRAAEDEINLRILQMRLRDKEELEEKEATAYVYSIIGRSQVGGYVGRQMRLAQLIWMKQIKEARAYRKVRSIRTWVNFCSECGENWRNVDRAIEEIGDLADEFLTNLVKINFTTNDAKRLSKALSADGSNKIYNFADFSSMTIDGKTFPLDEDHKEEIMETVAEVLDRARKEAKKATSELAEAQKEHEAESKDYRVQIKDLKLLTVDPTIPEQFQQIFKGIEAKVTEIITLANRLNFKATFGEADDELLVKRNCLVSINIMEHQFTATISALKDAIIER